MPTDPIRLQQYACLRELTEAIQPREAWDAI